MVGHAAADPRMRIMGMEIMNDATNDAVSGLPSGGDAHIMRVAGHGVRDDAADAGAGAAGAAPSAAGASIGIGPRHREPDSHRHARRRSWLIEWGPFIAVPLVVVLLRMFVFGLYVIPSGSMKDTLQIGDRVLTSKLSPKLFPVERGDVVVFQDPANWLGAESGSGSPLDRQYLIKRAIGLPGDHVACCTAGGQVTVNGVAIDESSYLRPGEQPSLITFDVTVTEGHLFVMGDNRSHSADSRLHADDGANGLVPIDDVVGVGKLVYWPFGRFHGIGRPSDVFAEVPDADATDAAATDAASAASSGALVSASEAMGESMQADASVSSGESALADGAAETLTR